METHSPLVALSQTAPGDKSSRRLQADFADSFKPLERFDCPGTVSLISFKNCQIIMDKYGYIIIISKSPGKMVHDFCIQAKVEDATIYLAGHGCPKYDCGQKRWFHEKLRYVSSFFRRMTQLTQRTQRPLRNASSLNPASTIAFVIAPAAKTRMGGCEGRSASATKPGEGHSPLGWGHERTRIRPGFG